MLLIDVVQLGTNRLASANGNQAWAAHTQDAGPWGTGRTWGTGGASGTGEAWGTGDRKGQQAKTASNASGSA